MRDNIEIHISQSLLERVATTLEAIAAQRREVIAKSSEVASGDEAESWNAMDAARQLERDAHEIRLCVQYKPDNAKEVDQLSIIKQLRDNLEKEGLPRSFHHVSPADDIKGMFRHAMEQRKQAFDAWSALVDDQRVNLRAVKLMVERALQCDTHRRKDSTLYVLLDTMQNMLVDLLEIDVDEARIDDYWSHRNQASWEVRKVLSENRRLQAHIKSLENAQKVKDAQSVVSSDENGDEPDSDIAF